MIFAFEGYLLDTDRRELQRSGEIVSVEPQVFDILECLVRNRASIVSKDDLLTQIWGRRIVSDSTITSRMTAARHAIGDSGKAQRLIKTFSRRGFRFVGRVAERPDTAKSEGSVVSTDGRPSIAILPFAGKSGGRHDGLVYGLVEDVITGLSQFRWLSVVARSLSCAHEGWAVDIRRVGRDLGAHYVLEGSVRKIDSRLRVTARLVDISDGTQLWARRFDATDPDSFAEQDQICAGVVGAIGSSLERLEIDRLRRRLPENLNANQCYLRGMGHLYQWNKDGIDDALALFRKAIELDPEFAPAYGMAAYCYVQRQSYGWISSRMDENADCALLARKAAALAADDAVTLSKAAHATAAVVGDLDSGAILIEQALRSNPNLAGAWYVSAWIRLFLGDSKLAGEHAGRAMKLNPFDPLAFKMRAALAYAHFFERRYDDAVALSLNAVSARPSYLTAMRCAAASHALAGRRDEARRLIAAVRGRDPALRLSNLSALLPFRARAFDRWAGALQKAGLPD